MAKFLPACPTVPAPSRGTVGQTVKTGTAHGTNRGTGSLKALASKVLSQPKVGQPVGQGAGQAVPERSENIEAVGQAICIFCRQPVERGTPGTGALAGDDLHMDCYRKQYPHGQ